MKLKRAIQIFFYGTILIALIGTLLSLSIKTIDTLISLIISLFLSLIFSAFSGEIIEIFSDDKLKRIFWTIEFEIFDYTLKIPISLFTILTILIKSWLF